MSSSELDLIRRIIGEYYGEIVESVSLCVAKFEPTPFRDVVKNSNLKVNQVKKALSLLVQHGMVTFNMPSRDKYAVPAPVNYLLNRAGILARIRYPSYIYLVEKAYGYEAELIVEEILKHGQIDMNTVIENVHKRVSETSEGNPTLAVTDIYDKFAALVKNRFICRSSTVSCLRLNDASTNDDAFCQNAYVVPTFDASELKGRKRKLSAASSSGPPSKKPRTTELNEERVYWQLNIPRFHEAVRDRIIVEAICRKYGKTPAEIVRTILKQNEGEAGNQFQNNSLSFVSLSLNEIMRALPAELKLTRAVVEEWLRILTDSAGEFISRTDDGGGGVYQIVFQRAFNELCASHVESVVTERFGSLSHRIFRLLLVKQHLAEKEIMNQTMISGDNKSLLRRLLDEKFVSLTVVHPLGDYNPKMSTYLFCVDLKAVATMLLKRSYKSLSNLMSRRQTLTKEHESLVNNEQRIEYILHSLDPTDTESREEYSAQISPADRAALKKFKLMVNKLEVAELQIDDTIFVLETYLEHVKTAWLERSTNEKPRGRNR